MKNTMNLQLFAEAVQGKRIVYLYRILEEAEQEDASGIAFTTENGRTVSVDADSTATKDGPIRTPGTPEIEITATSVLAKGDKLIDKLEEAQIKSKLLEIWETSLDEEGTLDNVGKFKAKYYQGYVTEFEKNSSAEDFTEISLTFGINGTGADGYATVSEKQQEIAAYVFADTQKTGA